MQVKRAVPYLICSANAGCQGIQMEYSGGKKTAYIQGIGNLYEQDGGRWSGWMYSVNGKYAKVSCGEYTLKDGDEVQWNYSCDLGADLKGTDKEKAKEWKEKNRPFEELHPACLFSYFVAVMVLFFSAIIHGNGAGVCMCTRFSI